MKTYIQKIRSTVMLMLGAVIALCFSSCDAHKDFPDTAMKVGHVLCTDGSVHSLSDVKSLNKQPIGVVFHINQSDSEEGLGYAIHLQELESRMFADTLGIPQGTSTSLTAFDGNKNTFSLYETKDANSPLAQSVFELWHNNQSAYVPSVAQMRLLFAVKDIINPVIKECGGTPIPSTIDECWFWTSTEVKDMETSKAWLYSLESGAIHETSKKQAHKARPIITLND